MHYMKIYILLIITILMACSGDHYPKYLTDAAELTESNPDSAVIVLKKMRERVAKEDKATYMYYRLLCIKADDRTYKEQNSPDEILDIVKFYEWKQDPVILPTAYYYAGSVYRDLKDGPQAIIYFQKALDGYSVKENPVMRARTYSQLGYIFRNQYMFDNALDMFQKAYEYDVIIKDTMGIVYDLGDIGNIFKEKEKYDSCLIYISKAFEIAQKGKDKEVLYNIANDMASIYNIKKDYNKALEYINISFKSHIPYNQSPIYSVAMKTYYALGMNDSVRLCYDKLMDVGNIYGKRNAYKIMALMSHEEGRKDEAMEYMRKFISANDSVYNAISADAVAKANALYNYSIRERRNKELEMENYRMRNSAIMMVLVCVVLALSIALLTMYYKKRQARMTGRIEELKKIKDSIYQKSDLYIKENEKRIEELNGRIESTDRQNRELKEELERERLRLKHDNEIAFHRMEEERIHQENIVTSDIYKRITGIVRQEDGTMLSAEEWKEAENLIEKEYPGFSRKLKSMCKLSEHELHICLLLKMGLSPSNISTVTSRSRESLSSSRRRMYEKTTGKKGTPKNWDEIIEGL